jgi:hypothetical protein
MLSKNYISDFRKSFFIKVEKYQKKAKEYY